MIVLLMYQILEIMKKILLCLLLSAAFIAPLSTLADINITTLAGREKHNDRNQSGRRNNGSGRPGSSSRPNGSNRPSRPSQPTKPEKPNKPTKPGQPSKPTKPGQPSSPTKPGYHPNPGGSHHPSPGRPGGPSYHPSHSPRPGSVPPPGYRPYRPNPQHYPSLRNLIKRNIGRGRLINVWQYGPDAYIARYYLNGRYWMQRFFPGVGRYDAPFVVYQNADGWYDDYNYRYVDGGDILQVFINGVAQNPWTLIPSFQLNINL